MAPYYNQGKEFRIENDLDDILIRFVQALDIFDYALDNRQRILRLRASPAFLKAFAELGQPFGIEKYWPVSKGAFTGYSPRETNRLFDQMSTALEQKDRRTWNRLKESFVDHVMAEFRSNTAIICAAIHGQGVPELIETVRDSKDFDKRKMALIRLVELDMTFFTLLPIDNLIIRAELSQDLDFKAALSRALDPKRQTRALEKQRQRHALFILSSLGYRTRSYSDWSKFFEYFNSQLGDQSGRPRESGFWSFKHWYTLKAAIKKYSVPKEPAKPGPRKSQIDNS